MRSCTLLAPAKINLYLEILGDRPDGYHELAMVMQAVGLCDRISLQVLDTPGIHLSCNHPDVPDDATNLAHKAVTLMQQQFPEVAQRYGGIAIRIDKSIPVGAGLAGGSTNAAAVLVGLDLLWQLGLTKSELQTLGARLGSDVPFCIAGGTALATGRGEQLSALPSLHSWFVVLAKYRSLSVSTVWAYQTYRKTYGDEYLHDEASRLARRERVHSGPIMSAILHHSIQHLGQNLYNDLERVVLPEYAAVRAVRDYLRGHPQICGAMMSGSGPTVFGLAQTQVEAEQAASDLRLVFPDSDLEIWVAPVLNEGIQWLKD